MKVLRPFAVAVRMLAGAVIGTAILGVVCVEHAAAQKWPEKTVRIVTPFGTGGGTEFVAKAPADGYTLLMTSASFSCNPGLYQKLRYDSVKDFAPVSLVVRVPHVIVVLPTFPARNLQEFVKLD